MHGDPDAPVILDIPGYSLPYPLPRIGQEKASGSRVIAVNGGIKRKIALLLQILQLCIPAVLPCCGVDKPLHLLLELCHIFRRVLPGFYPGNQLLIAYPMLH